MPGSPHPLPFDPIAEAARQWEAHGWGDAALGMSVVTSVVRAQQLFAGRVDHALEPFGITFARYEILTLLSFTREGELPVGKLGDRLQVHGTTVTAVERLERQGFVERRRHPDDGRAVLVAITDDGRRVVAEATPVLNDAVFRSIELSGPQQQQLYRTLRTLRGAAGDFE